MRTSSRFTIAVHTLLAIAYFSGKLKTTSELLASGVGVNPVIIRRTLGSLKKAGLVTVEAGVGGASLTRPAECISLLDVLDAVEADGHGEVELFSFHEHPNPACPVGGSIHNVLDDRLGRARDAMRASLAETSIADLKNEVDG